MSGRVHDDSSTHVVMEESFRTTATATTIINTQPVHVLQGNVIVRRRWITQYEKWFNVSLFCKLHTHENEYALGCRLCRYSAHERVRNPSFRSSSTSRHEELRPAISQPPHAVDRIVAGKEHIRRHDFYLSRTTCRVQRSACLVPDTVARGISGTRERILCISPGG